MTVGRDVVIRPGARLECLASAPGQNCGHLQVGSGTQIEHRVHIGAAFSVEIGEETLIASDVTILDHDHQMPTNDAVSLRDMPLVGAPIRIGRSVWIGEKATVLKGVTIGARAIVGAHAVVTKDVPPGAVVVGVPARVVERRRAPE
jgi:acetyltransferase-like isoleucine patch superfamily enzyme